MRIARDRDAYECRCGLSLDAAVLFQSGSSGKPIPDDAWHQGQPWIEREPGIVVSNDFADIGTRAWEWTDIPNGELDMDAWGQACMDAFECSWLRYMGRVSCRKFELDTGEILERQRVYAICPLGLELLAMRDMLQAIRIWHGPGLLWALGDWPIHPMKNHATDCWRGAEVGGVMHVAMACYYFHRPAVAQ